LFVQQVEKALQDLATLFVKYFWNTRIWRIGNVGIWRAKAFTHVRFLLAVALSNLNTIGPMSADQHKQIGTTS
jgi:hypothetical protein